MAAGSHKPSLSGACPDPASLYFEIIRSVAQSGSAPALGAGGPRFESLYSDQES